MSATGPFLHQPSNRYCWWSTTQGRYVFDDGTPVPGATSSSATIVGSIPGAGAQRRSPAPSSSGPAYATPRQLPSSSTVPPQEVGKNVSPIEWKKWRQGEPFGKEDTVQIKAGHEPPISWGRVLGHGSFATVQAVQVHGASSPCALKLYKSRPSLVLSAFQKKFENEIQNMRRVSNRHIARFFGAYICERKSQPTEFGILMQPVAEGTLEYVISNYRAAPENFTNANREHLSKYFGCLSSALEFVHQHMIRHKDVKTDNILIYQGQVLLADFGSSWDGVDQKNLITTTDPPQGHTPRFAAPEVVKQEPRSVKSDVFSLGGVFYELLSAIETDVRWYKEDYCVIANHARAGLQARKTRYPEVVSLIIKMLNPQPDGRPSAPGLVGALPEKHFCASCWEDPRTKAAQKAAQRAVGTDTSLAQAMTGMSLQTNPASIAGQSGVARSSTVIGPGGTVVPAGNAPPAARRGSGAPQVSSSGPVRNYTHTTTTSSSRRTVRRAGDSSSEED